MYPASAVESATEAWFFELQVTAPPVIVIIYPLVDFLSDPPAQSASVTTSNNVSELSLYSRSVLSKVLLSTVVD
jgi:hypothetical protein